LQTYHLITKSIGPTKWTSRVEAHSTHTCWLLGNANSETICSEDLLQAQTYHTVQGYHTPQKLEDRSQVRGPNLC
jgi:hypothetical protein